MSEALRRRIGFELELLAPPGSSRRTLADALATDGGGIVRPVWHQDSEPSPLPHLGGRFLHLTQGFEVLDAASTVVCTLVDDVTIVTELDQAAPAPPGWHRIVTNDARLLRLLARVCDPGSTLDTALEPAAAIWGESVEQLGDVWRLDSAGETVALATASGGERERPCEIVTPPLVADHGAALERLLGPARALGFTIPQEAAVHLHVDAAPFRDPAALANLIRLFAHWREPLRDLLGTNPQCRRLKALPHELVDAAAGTPSFQDLYDAAGRGELTKFYDVNLSNLLRPKAIRDTVEIRVLPGSIDADDVLARAALVDRLLDRCLEPTPIPAPPGDHAAAVEALSAL